MRPARARMESSSSIARTSSNRRRSFSFRLRRPTRWTGRYLSVCPLRRPSPAEHGRTRPRKRRCHEQQREQWIESDRIAQLNSEDSAEAPRPQPPLPTEPALAEDRADAQQPTSHATREGSDGKSGIEKSKLIMLGGGLLAAVLFLALTSLVNHSSTTKKAAEKQPSQSGAAANAKPIQGERHALDGDRSDQRSGEYFRAGASGRHQAHQHSGTGRGR